MGLLDRTRNSVLKFASRHYEYAAVYEGPEEIDIIYEGEIWIHLNGWIELENGDQLSAQRVYKIQNQTFF